MPLVTTTTMPPAIQASFDQTLLSTPTRNFIHSICAERRRMPRNGGDIIRFKRYSQLDSAMVPLGTSGITPPSSDLVAVYIDAKMSFYGAWIGINEQVQLQSQDSVLNAAAIRLGVQLRQTEDDLARDMLAATANMLNCVNGINGRKYVAVVKSPLIDLELLPDNAGDNRAEESLKNFHRDRLSEETSFDVKEDATVGTLWKHREVAEMTTRLGLN